MQFAPDNFTPASATTLSKPLLFVGALLGFLLSIGALFGDDYGRLNLLYLLFIYVCIPLLGALFSVISLLKGKGLNIARLLSDFLPSKTDKAYLRKAHQLNMDKPWFFLQSQGVALAYAGSSALVFGFFLVFTDMNFVWRSTILDAEQILPLLQIIALPWWFLESAQANLELIQATQDSRLNESYSNVTIFGQWWQFVFATLIVYSFILRGLLLFGAKLWLKKLARDARKSSSHAGTINVTDALNRNLEKNRKARKQHTLSPITYELLEQYALSNWASLTQNIVSQLNLRPQEELPSGATIVDSNESKNAQNTLPQLLLVKAWEPPMGELQDYMEHTQGLLYPVNYKKEKVIPPESNHLEEWQRFIAKIPNWGIYQAPTNDATKQSEIEGQGEQNAE